VQREGEHPYCGPNKLEENSGFSYDPYVFICEDINVKLLGWKDMSVPESINFILDIVKDMSKTIKEQEKKVIIVIISYRCLYIAMLVMVELEL
jgi:hypothetical protein